ncbi:MAG: tetratricopeptide repeat protein, partial [Bacteroidota bacterium]
MKKLLFLIGFLISFSWVGAQNSKLEALEEQLKTQPADTVRVNLINDWVAKQGRRNPDIGLQFVNEAIHLSDSLGFAKGKAWGLFSQGGIYRVKGRYDEAIALFLESIALFDSLSMPKHKGYVYNELGVTYRNRSLFPEAVDAHQKAAVFFEEGGYELGVANALNNEGNAHKRTGNVEKELEVRHRALAISRKLKNIPLESLILMNLANRKLTDGEVSEALKRYQEVETIYLNNNAPEIRLADLRVNMAIAYTELG